MKPRTKRIQTKRIYSASEQSDGQRILIDRLWPRGVSKDAAEIDFWAKEVAPSSELRKWYQHDASKWDEFRKRYFAELDSNTENVEKYLNAIGKGTVTFVYGSKEEKFNNAVALKEYMDAR